MAQQVRNKISLAEQVRRCMQCKNYSSQPLWGHFYCSFHRVCTGYDRWVPEDCPDCLKQNTLLMALTPEERPSFIKQLKEMCIRTREFKLKKGIHWQYVNEVSRFMGQEISGLSTRSIDMEAGNTPASLHTQSIHASEGQHSQRSLSKVNKTLSSSEQILLSQLKESLAKNPISNHSLSRHSERTNVSIFNSFHSGQCSRRTNYSHQASNMYSSRKRSRSPSVDTVYDEQNQHDNSSGHYSGSQRSVFSRHSSDDLGDYFMDNDFPKQNVQKPQINKYLDNNKSLDRCFISDGIVYVLLDKHHLVSGGKVWLEGEFKDVKWHKSGKGFTTTGMSPPSQSPYTDNGHDAIVALGNLEQVSSDTPGANRKCFRTNFDQKSGLGQVFDSLRCNENNAMQALYRNDTKALGKAFPEIIFSAITTANFTSGWTASESEYLKFAKHTHLDTTAMASIMKLRFVPSVSTRLLDEERDNRKKVVDQLTVLKSLELAAEDPDTSPKLALGLKGISRQSLAILEDLIKNWYISKYAVRKSFLQYRSGPAATQLLTSNLWESTIFPKKIVDSLNASGTQYRDLGYMLKLVNPNDYSNRNNSKSNVKSQDRSQRREEYRSSNKSHSRQQSFQKNPWKKGEFSKDYNTKTKSSKPEFNKRESTDDKSKKGYFKKQNSAGTSGSGGNKKQRK